MNQADRSHFLSRAFLQLFWGCLCLLVVLAPLSAQHGWHTLSALDYLLFSAACHQLPQRCFTAGGLPWAACQRCTGIYFGLFVTVFLPVNLIVLLSGPMHRRRWVLLATAPLLVDVLLSAAGFWKSSPISRVGTGFLFGSMLATLLVPGVAEIESALAGRPHALEQTAAQEE